MSQLPAPAIPPHHHEEFSLLDDIRSEMKAMRADIQAEMRDMRTELKADINSLRTELKGDINSLRTDVASLHKTTDTIALHLNGAVEDIKDLKTRAGRLETNLDLSLPLLRGLAMDMGQLNRHMADLKLEVVGMRNDLGV